MTVQKEQTVHRLIFLSGTNSTSPFKGVYDVPPEGCLGFVPGAAWFGLARVATDKARYDRQKNYVFGRTKYFHALLGRCFPRKNARFAARQIKLFSAFFDELTFCPEAMLFLI